MGNTYSIEETVELTTMKCGECGIVHAMPEHFREERQSKGGNWYCPNGHSRVYRESDVAAARRERDEALTKLSASKCETAREKAARELAEKQITLHRRRTKNGVCPCCKRSFQNLKRHITTKHPEYK